MTRTLRKLLQSLLGSLRDLLDEMRVRNPDMLQYEFTDPSASLDEETRNKVYEQLQKEGLQYTGIRTRGKGSESEVIVWPGAIVSYQGRSVPVQLLKSQMRSTDAEMVNRSVNNLEYEMASAIRQAVTAHKARVAFLEGQGELAPIQVQDLAGRTVQQPFNGMLPQGPHRLDLSTASLPDGIYLLRISTGGAATTLRFNVAHP